MLSDFLTTQNITLVIVIAGVIFTIYNSFRNPQVNLDKKQAVDKQEEVGKATVLAQQLQWQKELNDKRFDDMGLRIDRALTLAENHTHTVDVKVDDLKKEVGAVQISLEKLTTIIDERVPKKAS